MFEDLSRRRRAPEIMDGPDLASEEHRAALDGLERLNVLALHARPFWREIAPLARQGAPLRVLDLASGGGGLVCALRHRARRAGIELMVDGCDRSATAVAHAEARAARGGLENGRFFVWDVIAQGVPEGYDVITNSLFLHHLSDAEAISFLEEIRRRAGRLALVSDILRTRLGLAMVQLACRTLGGSRVVVEDGLTSLKAAFTLRELEEIAKKANWEGITVARVWPERALLRLERRV